METMFETTSMRELDYRSTDGIEVRLLWEPGSDRLFVAVVDERSNDRFRFRVDALAALDAFHHPFAYGDRPAPEVVADLSGSEAC